MLPVEMLRVALVLAAQGECFPVLVLGDEFPGGDGGSAVADRGHPVSDTGTCRDNKQFVSV